MNSGRDSVMGEGLGGQSTGFACPAGSGTSPELKVESQLTSMLWRPMQWDPNQCWLGLVGISFQGLP